MRRLTLCLAFLLTCCPLGAQAGAATPDGDLVGVDLVSPPSAPAVVENTFVNSEVAISGADSAAVCIQRHLAELQLPLPQLPVRCDLVSYVVFWVDLPRRQLRHPQPFGGCPASAATCRYMGQDEEAPYSLVHEYTGPGGRHTATAQVWRYVWGDPHPVLLGQASGRFCLYDCKSP
jgi:hypothetical protein